MSELDDILSGLNLPTVDDAGIDVSPHTFAERLQAALAKRTPVDPHQKFNLGYDTVELQDLTTAVVRAFNGYGHFPEDVRLRDHLTRPDGLPWAYSSPETCLVADQTTGGVWINSEHLVCPGCGLEFT